MSVGTQKGGYYLPHELKQKNATPQQDMLQELVGFDFPGQQPAPSPKFSYSPIEAFTLSDAMLDEMILSHFCPTPDPQAFDLWLCSDDLEPLPLLMQDYQKQKQQLLARQTCSNCATQSTPLWRKTHDGRLPLCNVTNIYLIIGMWNL
jgi:hypothetical protein